MVIIEDSRQQKNKHEHKAKYFESQGIKVLRSKLPFGDYMSNPSDGTTIDTKMDIYELAKDIDQDHVRFRNELIGARDYGYKLIILTENTNGVSTIQDLGGWDESIEHFEMRKIKSKNPKTRRISGVRLARACMTMQERYGATFMFCSPQECGQRIVELLQGEHRE